MRESPSKVVIYCRVSTKEQVETGYSLESQENACKEFAIRNGYQIKKVFIEKGESAKTQDRPELIKLIKYSIENKKEISALVIWKLDRLARNLYDQTDLLKNFSRLDIRVLSATENNENSPEGRLMRNIHGSFAQYENDIKSERTISGMKQAIKEGRWCWPAPIGYKNDRDLSNRPILKPTDDSKYVEQIFELASLGIYKQTEIVEIVKKDGFIKITVSLLNRILKNPLYCGLIKVKWFNEYFEAIHEPIISKDDFFKVQNILNRGNNIIRSNQKLHPDFPLRNFIICAKCEVKLTGGWSTGRKGKKYAYYNCRTKGCSFNMKKEELEDKFLQYLKDLLPNQEIIDLFESIVIDVWKNNKKDSITRKNKLARDIESLEKRRNQIEDYLLNGTFDEHIYKRKSEEVNAEILHKEISLQELNNEIEDVDGYIEFCKYFLGNINEIWVNGDINLRQKVQNLIFPDKTYYENQEFRTTQLAPIFNIFRSNTLDKLSLVAPTGFEPVFQP